MTEKIKTTAPVLSVGADREQPNTKNHKEIIANETAQINLQAAQNPEKSRSGGLQIVSMTELYDTVYPPRTPVVDGFLYGGTYLFVGAPKVGKSFFMWHWKMITQGFSADSPVCSVWNVRITCTLRHRQRP